MLRPVYSERLRQRCHDASDTAPIENKKDRITLKWVTTPFWSNCIVFNRNSIGERHLSVVADAQCIKTIKVCLY